MSRVAGKECKSSRARIKVKVHGVNIRTGVGLLKGSQKSDNTEPPKCLLQTECKDQALKYLVRNCTSSKARQSEL